MASHVWWTEGIGQKLRTAQDLHGHMATSLWRPKRHAESKWSCPPCWWHPGWCWFLFFYLGCIPLSKTPKIRWLTPRDILGQGGFATVCREPWRNAEKTGAIWPFSINSDIRGGYAINYASWSSCRSGSHECKQWFVRRTSPQPLKTRAWWSII